jgi:signal transduction histidine kinase/CheY-like chemotaxis protein
MLSRIRRFQGFNQLVPGLIASLTVVALIKLNALVPIERAANNQMLRWRGARDWDNRIVMITIDNKTLRELGQFPIRRNHYAQLLWRLKQESVGVVTLNILFADNIAGLDPAAGSADNALLAGAMSSFGKVVISQDWDDDGKALPPIPVLAETAIAVGHLRFKPDSDGITRWVPVVVENIPTLGVATIQAYSLQKELISIPTDLRNLIINWPGPANHLTTLSFLDVLKGQYPAGYFKDKIVIVCYGATAGQTELRTPFDQQDSISEGYLHAAVVNTLLHQNWLRPVSMTTVIGFVLLGGPALSALLYRRDSLVKLVITAGLVAGWLVGCLVALHFSFSLPVVPPLATLVLVGAAVSILNRLQANALLQVRSAFLNTMSHEIRTPLNAIVNLSEMLQETPLNDRQREFAETLNHSSQVLMSLINDILDFSKIESGRLMIEEYPVQLNDIVERSLEMLAPRAAEKGLEMVYSITPTTPAVIMSDPVRLQQILLNLLSNAVKFTERGEISVHVQAAVIANHQSLFSAKRLRPSQWTKSSRLRKSLSSGALSSRSQMNYLKNDRYEIRFAVHDTGIGIPPERISQLFQPFSQVSASTTRKYGGTGLGLSISKRLSDRMGGNLWVRSYPNEGSTFYFTVQAHLAQATIAPPSDLAPLSGARLLLIDRNITRRNHLSWELQPLGIRLAQATSIPEAMMFVQNDPTFDGIVLDESVTNSAEACAIAISILRQTACNQHLPVILLRAQKKAVPASPYPPNITIVWKPLKQAALYQALRAINPSEPILSSAILPSLLPSSPTESHELINVSDAEMRREVSSEVLGEMLGKVASKVSSEVVGESATLVDKGTEPNNRRLNILIAEDNSINQRVALRLLELLGYRADVVSSGREALVAVQHQRYDVILMDMRMPELDGVETTRQIRQMPQHANTWIIAMTANAMAQDRELCFEAGMDDYLTKPINRTALGQALQRVLSRQ